ncbi:hypothetical protein OUHCRE11_47110 [Enterobacter asburiae]
MNLLDIPNLTERGKNIWIDNGLAKPILINGDCVTFIVKDCKVEKDCIRLEVEELVNCE